MKTVFQSALPLDFLLKIIVRIFVVKNLVVKNFLIESVIENSLVFLVENVLAENLLVDVTLFEYILDLKFGIFLLKLPPSKNLIENYSTKKNPTWVRHLLSKIFNQKVSAANKN